MYWPFENIDPKNLIARAREARERAYVPYSHFPVGAAVFTDQGHIVPGCNVENGSFGMTICAERTAIVSSVVAGAGRPVAVAVVGRPGEPCLPCGACRQVLAEFNPDVVVLLEDGNELISWRLEELMPHRFILTEKRTDRDDC